MMTSKPYKHQQEVLDMNPDKRLIAFGCGAGKTRTVLWLCKQKEASSILIVAPKTQVEDRTWEKETEKMNVELPIRVISKEQFKKGAPAADILVVDESHFVVGVLPTTRYRNKIEIPRTSQLFEETMVWIKMHRPKAIYLASATPFPQPMALWAVGHMFGEDWDYFSFRRKFYSYIPSIGRGIWVPKRDEETKQLLMLLAQKLGSFGRLEDFFDVPDQVFKDITVGVSPQQKKAIKELPMLYPDPIVRIGKTHKAEQGLYEGTQLDEYKIAEIIELAKEFPKLLVFAKYTEQVDRIAEQLKKTFKRKDIFVLDGRTKNRGEMLDRAEEKGKETIVVVQSQVSTGYQLPSFRCTVFASCTYSFVDYEQALGRSLRGDKIAKNVYVHLLAGEIDKAVLKCVREKRDFNEAIFAKDYE